MKTNFPTKLLALIVAGTFSIKQAQGQTALSGTIANNCANTAGNAGTGNTNVGCSAGRNIAAGASYNVSLGENAMYNLTTGDYNTAIGKDALYTTTNGSRHTMIGYQAGYSISADLFDNTFGGYQSGYSNTTNGNSFWGSYSGYSNTTGTGNVLTGYKAGYYNATGGYNSIYGYEAGLGASTNDYSNNSLFGYRAGYSNTTGGSNTFAGYQSGYSNTTGGSNIFTGYQSGYSNTTASENAFSGALSGYSNTTGTSNVLSGFKAGYYNATGSYNTIMGYEAGLGVSTYNYSYNTFIGYKSGRLMAGDDNYSVFVGGYSGSNTANGYNTYIGYISGFYNTTGIDNAFLGTSSGYNNTSGSDNTFIGRQSGYTNSTGYHNTFLGLNSGYYTTTGSDNTFLGYKAGATKTDGTSNTTGSNNTIIGSLADVAANNYTNATALGNGAIITASNQAFAGNANLTAFNIPAGATYGGSDGRFKFNVKENVKGLEFISKLRPVTYQMNTQQLDAFLRRNIHNQADSSGNPIINNTDYTQSKNIIHSGFIAQEVEQAAKDCGFTSSIVRTPGDSNDYYGLSYGEFVVPLVKAVQELSAYNENLEQRITQLETLLSECCASSPARQTGNSEEGSNHNKENAIPVELQSSDKVILYQNIPNPFGDGTVINYYLPETVNNAKIVFYDDGGKAIKEIPLKQKGNGSLTIDSSKLAGGMYSYSIVVNGKVADTKKMTRSR